MYKTILLPILTTFTLASTDMLPPSEASKELAYIATDNYECNYYLELAGQDLLSLANYDTSHKPIKVKKLYQAFMDHSTKAREICIHINKLVVDDIIEIQDDITYFYNQNYK